MHSKIIQLSTEPLPKNKWAREDQFYDGFVGWIADYVNDDITVEERDFIIDDFCDYLKREYSGFIETSPQLSPPTLHRSITFKKGFKEAFFNEMKKRLSKIAEVIEDVDMPYKLRNMLMCVTGDQFGTYVYEEWTGLSTEQRFLENVEETTYYFGSVVDYHY